MERSQWRCDSVGCEARIPSRDFSSQPDFSCQQLATQPPPPFNLRLLCQSALPCVCSYACKQGCKQWASSYSYLTNCNSLSSYFTVQEAIHYSYQLRLAFVPRLASKVASSALSQQVKRGGNLRLATIDGVALEKRLQHLRLYSSY